MTIFKYYGSLIEFTSGFEPIVILLIVAGLWILLDFLPGLFFGFSLLKALKRWVLNLHSRKYGDSSIVVPLPLELRDAVLNGILKSGSRLVVAYRCEWLQAQQVFTILESLVKYPKNTELNVIKATKSDLTVKPV